MSDRDYNSPEYDRPNYETAEEYNRARREREEQMAEEGQNPYGENYNYNNYNYDSPNNSSYNNSNSTSRVYTGSTMTDATGKPLKNYFALKLVLSIMMIMGCCCSNFFLVIVGIIALVFTCMANSAYQQGKAEEFRKNSKISSVLLGIGGAVMVVMLLMGIIFFSMANSEFEDATGENIWDILRDEVFWDDPESWEDLFENFEDYDSLEDPETDVQQFDDRTEPLPDGYSEFIWENKVFSVPMSYDRFMETGFILEDFSITTEVQPGDLEFFSFEMDNGYYGSLCFSNYGDETRNITECDIDYLYFYNDEYSTLDITFFDGLTWGCSLGDVKAFLGEPQYISTQTYPYGDVYQTVSWNYYKNGTSQGVTVSFDNDKMYTVSIEWYNK